MTCKEVSSLGEFVEAVCDIRIKRRLAESQSLWFRGEERDYSATRLTPKIFRRQDMSDWDKLELECQMFEEFTRSIYQFTDAPSDDMQIYFLMQHHGAPTRLLDWSNGFLMALHFAVRNKKQEDTSNAYVYVFDSQAFTNRLPAIDIAKMKSDRGAPEDEWPADDDESSLYLPYDDATRTNVYPLPAFPIVLTFPHITRRVAAQRSKFVVFGSDPHCLSNEVDSKNPAIDVIPINGACAGMIRKQLREAGITESVIFPDLDGLGREFDQLWQDRSTPY